MLLLLGPMLAPRIDPLLAPLSSMQWAGLITGLWVLGTGLTVVVLQLREQWLRATQTALLGTVVTLLLLWGWVIPLTEPIIKLSPPIAQAIRTHTADEVPVGVFGYYEPSLTLYLMRDRPEKLGDEAQVLSWLSRATR
ncbi:MAG: hypothetical protein HC898_07825 [Phycisphaerales bacterium]|nr:hypothetical protein [Phycisphaerales bacterium]